MTNSQPLASEVKLLQCSGRDSHWARESRDHDSQGLDQPSTWTPHQKGGRSWKGEDREASAQLLVMWECAWRPLADSDKKGTGYGPQRSYRVIKLIEVAQGSYKLFYQKFYFLKYWNNQALCMGDFLKGKTSTALTILTTSTDTETDPRPQFTRLTSRTKTLVKILADNQEDSIIGVPWRVSRGTDSLSVPAAGLNLHSLYYFFTLGATAGLQDLTPLEKAFAFWPLSLQL